MKADDNGAGIKSAQGTFQLDSETMRRYGRGTTKHDARPNLL